MGQGSGRGPRLLVGRDSRGKVLGAVVATALVAGAGWALYAFVEERQQLAVGTNRAATSEDAVADSDAPVRQLGRLGGGAYVHGLDVSHYQGKIDWKAVASHGDAQEEALRPAFVFIKKSQGVGFQDPRFRHNALGAKDARLARGAYHVFDPNADVGAQVASFLKGLSGYQLELAPVLDLESGILTKALATGESVTDSAENIGAWLAQVEAETRRTPIVYVGHNAMVRYFRAERPIPSRYPVWVAEYTAAAEPNVPPKWLPWIVWQFQDSATLPGITGRVDLDRVRVRDYHKLLCASSDGCVSMPERIAPQD